MYANGPGLATDEASDCRPRSQTQSATWRALAIQVYTADGATSKRSSPFIAGGLDLVLSYRMGNMTYVKGSGGWGLGWAAAQQGGSAYRPIFGSQVVDRLSGSTQATIELVLRAIAISAMFSRYFHVGEGNRDGVFTLSTRNIDEVSLAMDNNAPTSPEARFTVDVSGQRIVLHLVFDSQQAVVQDRARLYVDGARQGSMFNAVSLGQTVDMLDLPRKRLGNRPVSDGARSFEGSL